MPSWSKGYSKEDAMWEIIRAGGGFMWPIILCSIAAVAIILERLWTLQSSRVIPRDLSQKVWNWIEADQLSEKLIAGPGTEFTAGQAVGHYRPR